jgi:2,4-dienoyl-CoA reductase-like NADH-dependent reductase (Old Yellow Enzyme family)
MQTRNSHHKIFTPLTLLHHRLKNRLVVAPMSRVSATNEGVPTDVMRRYYASFAKGGFAAIITEGLFTDLKYSRGYPNQPGIVTSSQIDKWKEITDCVKEQGGIFICQLMHAGALSQSSQQTIAPSAIQPVGKKMLEYGGGEGSFPFPKEIGTDEINKIVADFVQAAVNAYEAGFDGTEIHAANGYLLDQFLTDYTNNRSDRYGGSVENRFYVIKEIIKGIKQQVPTRFIIGLRLSEGKVNNLFYRWPEGATMAKELLAEVKKAAPTYIHIAAESGNWKRDCLFANGTSFSGLAKSIAEVPVIANGGLDNLEMADEVLEGNHADLISLGKAALADAHWPERIRNDEPISSFYPQLIKPSAAIQTNAANQL